MAIVPATPLIMFLAAILTVLGDVQRPTQGYQVGRGPGSDRDFIFPLKITQCEPVLIYYNTTGSSYVYLGRTRVFDFLSLYFPPGVGYVNWICNIPAGYSFEVHGGFGLFQYYDVQPGSSSACLGDVTTTYLYVSYYPTYFQSYTQHSPSPLLKLDQQPTIAFPTSSFPTITVNPNLAVTPTTTTTTYTVSQTLFSPPTSSTPVSSLVFHSSPVASPSASLSASPSISQTLFSPPNSSSPVSSLVSHSSPVASPSASPSISQKADIAGGVIGGVAFVLLVITVIFVFFRKRRTNAALKSVTPYSGLTTSQLGPNHPAGPGPSHSDPKNAIRRGGKINNRPAAVLDGRERNHDPAGKSTNRGADLASTLDVTRLTASQRQILMASLNTSANASANPATSPAPADATQTLTAPLQPSAREAAQEDFPEIANILGVISRAQLSPESRRVLVTALNNLLMIDQATPADSVGRNTSRLPPYVE